MTLYRITKRQPSNDLRACQDTQLTRLLSIMRVSSITEKKRSEMLKAISSFDQVPSAVIEQLSDLHKRGSITNFDFCVRLLETCLADQPGGMVLAYENRCEASDMIQRIRDTAMREQFRTWIMRECQLQVKPIYTLTADDVNRAMAHFQAQSQGRIAAVAQANDIEISYMDTTNN